MEDGQRKEDKILAKYEALKEERQTWEDEYKEISEYVFPRRSNWDKWDGKSNRSESKIFDGTPISALNLLANGLVGYLVSPATRWFKLRLPRQEYMNISGVRRWLEIVENVLYDEFSRSNFYEEVVEYFRDGGAFGTATMFVAEDIQNKISNFNTRHPKEVFLAENHLGRVDTVFRKFVLTARQMVDEFGYDNLSTDAQRLADKNPYERLDIIHALFPRKDRDVGKLDNKNMPYASVYIEESRRHIIRESGFEKMPYVVWRYSTNSDETYGRGPGYEALHDVKKSNKISESLLKSAQMMVDPPLNVPEEMRGGVNWVPRGLNFYNNPNSVVSPANTGTQYEPGLDREQHLREIIEQHFLVDFFLMLQRAPDNMTATEVMERQAEKAAILGTVIGRISSEFLDPVIDLTFDNCWKLGKVPPPPKALVNAMSQSDGRLEIDYIGPLAQAQKRFHVSQGVNQSMQALGPLMQMNPNIGDLINWDQLGMEVMRNYGMPETVIRDMKEVRRMRQQKAQQQQQMQQQQQATEMAKALPNDKPEEGTAMSEMNKQLAAAMKAQRGTGTPSGEVE